MHRRGLFRAGAAGRACLPSRGSVRARNPGCDFSRCPGVFGVRSGTVCADHPSSYPLLVSSNSLPDSPGFRPGEAILAWGTVGYARSACFLNSRRRGSPSIPQISELLKEFSMKSLIGFCVLALFVPTMAFGQQGSSASSGDTAALEQKIRDLEDRHFIRSRFAAAGPPSPSAASASTPHPRAAR